MKKFFKFLMAFAAVSAIAVSCSDDKTDDSGPIVNPTQDNYESLAKTSEGVSIYASEVTAKDFALKVEMGLDCASYRLEVLPTVKFENWYQEALKDNADLTLDEFILSRLINDIGNAGYAMNEPFDDTWAESVYNQAEIIPTIEYMILTCGCLDQEGREPGEINTLKFSLANEPLVGDPQVDIKLDCSYFGFEATYTMNDDCYGYYSMETKTSDIDDAIKWVGEKGLRDLICCFYKEPMTEDYTASASWPYADVEEWPVTSIVTPLDINGTPGNTYQRADGKLKKREDIELGEYSVEIGKASAFTCRTYFTIDFDKTRTVFYRYYADTAWKEAREKYTDSQLQLDMALNGGWGINVRSADPYDQWLWGDLTPNTKYYLVSTCTNAMLQFTPLNIKEFQTLPLVKDQPEKSLAQVESKFLKATKTAGTIEYTVVPEETTLYFDVILIDGARNHDTGNDLTDPENEAELIDYLLEHCNISANGKNSPYTVAGLDPGQKYHHYLVAEDINGYLSGLSQFEFSTLQNNGGPNPAVEITSKVVKEKDGSYSWKVDYTINEDVNNLFYCINKDNTINPDAQPTQAQLDSWHNQTMEYALKSVNSATQSITVTEYTQEVACAIAFGVGTDGAEVKTDLVYQVFNPKMIQSAVLPTQIRTKAYFAESIEGERISGADRK